MLGPGLTTGAADDDPSGITTYSQAGARYGLQFAWLAAFTFPLMAIVQEMCARIGLVTGRGLAANIRAYHSRSALYVCTLLLFVANTFNIGADLGAMAKASQLLFPGLNFALAVIFFTAVSVILQIASPYARYARYLKYLALILLAYVFSAASIQLDWREVFAAALTPSISFSRDQLLLLCAILGTTISPYLFFWQTSQEVEEEILKGKTSIKMRQAVTTDQDIKDMRIDVWSGMFLSNIVMLFIIISCAATLFVNGITDIASAAEAAQALRPFAGEWAYLLFAIGIIGTGLLAAPVLAGSASYAIAESFGWREGLYRTWSHAHAFYAVIIAAMGVGLLLNFIGLDPIQALIYSAVANGLIAPVILYFIVRISGSKKIMGQKKNHPLVTAIGWLTVALMATVAAATLYSLFV